MRMLTAALALMMAVPGLSPIVHTFIGGLSQTLSSATATFTAADIGSATPNRMVVVRVGTRASSTTKITGVTIGGIAARRLASTDSSALPNSAAIYGAIVPTGTTANIVISNSGTITRCAIAVSTIENYQSLAAYDNTLSSATSSATASANTVNVPEQSIALTCLSISTVADIVWQDTPTVVEEYENSPGSNLTFSAASYQSTDAIAKLFRADWVGSGARGQCSISIRRRLTQDLTSTLLGTATINSTVAIQDFGNFVVPREGVVVVLFTGYGSSARSMSSISIGGVTANLIADTGSDAIKAGIAYLFVTPGTVNVSVTLNGGNGSSADSRVSVWLLEYYASPVHYDSTSPAKDSGSSHTATMAIPVNGIAFYAMVKTNTGAVSWTSADDSAMDADGTSLHHSHAVKQPTPYDDAWAETASWTGSAGKRMVSMSMS